MVLTMMQCVNWVKKQGGVTRWPHICSAGPSFVRKKCERWAFVLSAMMIRRAMPTFSIGLKIPPRGKRKR